MPWIMDPVTGDRRWVEPVGTPIGGGPGGDPISIGTGDPPPQNAVDETWIYGPGGNPVGIIRNGDPVPLPTPTFPPSPGALNQAYPPPVRLGGAVLAEGGAVPIVYGQARVEAQQFSWVGGNPTYAGYAVCAGEIDSYVATYLNGEMFAYTGTFPLNLSKYRGTVAGNSNSNVLSSPGGYALLQPKLAWAAAELWGGVFPAITVESLAFEIKGKKVVDFRTGAAAAWSSNPILCLYDLLTDADWGAGIDSALLDAGVTGSWKDAADACDAVVDGAARYKLNVAIARPVSVQGAIDLIRAVCAADFYFYKGKLCVYVDGTRSSAALSVTEGTDCRNVVLTQTPPDDIPNVVVVEFPDAAKDFARNSVTLETDEVVTGSERRREARYQLEGCTSEVQATRLARIYLRRTSFAPRRIALICSPEAEELRIGDRIDVSAASCGLAAQPFVVEGLQRGEAGEWAVDGREYDAAVYSDDAVVTDSPPSVDEASLYDIPGEVVLVGQTNGLSYPGPAGDYSTLIYWFAPRRYDKATQYGASYWTLTGAATGDTSKVNDGIETVSAVDFSPVGACGLRFDAGAGNTVKFGGMRLVGNDGETLLWSHFRVEYSDDAASWTYVELEQASLEETLTSPARTGLEFEWKDAGAHRYWRVEKNVVFGNSLGIYEVQFWRTKTASGERFLAHYELSDASSGAILATVPAIALPTVPAPYDVAPFVHEAGWSSSPFWLYDIIVRAVSLVGNKSPHGLRLTRGTYTAPPTGLTSSSVLRQVGTPSAQVGSDALDGTRKGQDLQATKRLLLDSAPSAAVSGSGQIALRDNAGVIESSVDGAAYAGAALSAGGQPLHGVPLNASGGFDFSVSYNAGTRIFTFTPTGAAFDVWIRGTRYRFTGAQATSAHANSTGNYFAYVDETGAITVASSAWTLRKHAPLALVYFEASLAAAVLFEERHSAIRDPEMHLRFHEVDGTQVVSGFAFSGYTLQTDSTSGVTFAVASGVVADEDIRVTSSALADGGPYVIFERSGASGAWTWTTGNSLPYLAGTNRPYANLFSGGAWGRTEMGNGEYLNYWAFALPSPDATFQVILVPGQTIHASLAAAQAESVAALSWGTMPFQEIAPLARYTLRTSASYSATTKSARIEDLARIFGTKASITAAASPGAHNALSGRSDAGCHPASAISFTPTGTIAATDVQAAIAEVASEAGGGSLTVEESDGAPSVSPVSKIKFSGATVTDDTGGTVTVAVTGGGGLSLVTDTFTGAGTATQACDLSADLATGDDESVCGVYVDGVLQPTTDWTVTDANTITIDPGPAVDALVAIVFFATVPTGVTGVSATTDTGDGATTDFVLDQTAIANGLLGGYVDGVLQAGATLISGGAAIRYATAPADGANVVSVVLY